jgi:hypothetical protein
LKTMAVCNSHHPVFRNVSEVVLDDIAVLVGLLLSRDVTLSRLTSVVDDRSICLLLSSSLNMRVSLVCNVDGCRLRSQTACTWLHYPQRRYLPTLDGSSWLATYSLHRSSIILISKQVLLHDNIGFLQVEGFFFANKHA